MEGFMLHTVDISLVSNTKRRQVVSVLAEKSNLSIYRAMETIDVM
jgi:hypothetical protein